MFGLSKEEKFWKACKESDCLAIICQLKQHPLLAAYTDRQQKHGLTFAVESGDYNNVKAVLEHGQKIPISAYDKTAGTPLSIATKRRNLLMARLLIKHGADVTLKDYMNITPVWDESHRGAMEICGIDGFQELALECFIKLNKPITSQWRNVKTPQINTYNTDEENERQFGREMGQYCSWLSSYSDVFDDLHLPNMPNINIAVRMLVLGVSERCIQKVFHMSNERLANISQTQAKEVFDNFVMANHMSLSIDDLDLPSIYREALVDLYSLDIKDNLTCEILFNLYELFNEVLQARLKFIKQRWFLIQEGNLIHFMPIASVTTKMFSSNENGINAELSAIIPLLFGELQCKCKAHHCLC